MTILMMFKNSDIGKIPTLMYNCFDVFIGSISQQHKYSFMSMKNGQCLHTLIQILILNKFTAAIVRPTAPTI